LKIAFLLILSGGSIEIQSNFNERMNGIIYADDLTVNYFLHKSIGFAGVLNVKQDTRRIINSCYYRRGGSDLSCH